MNSLDSLYDYKFDTKIDSHLITQQKEYLCLATMKYCYPKKFRFFEHSDVPDLIDKRHLIGIEVVEIVDSKEAEINSKFNKLSTKERTKSRTNVETICEKDGTTISLTSKYRVLDFPMHGINHIKNVFRNRVFEKIKKSSNYTNKVNTIGLMLISDLLPTEAQEQWFKWVRPELQQSPYGFVYLLFPQHLDVFYCKSNWHRKIKICKNDYYALKVLSRLTAEKAAGIERYWA